MTKNGPMKEACDEFVNMQNEADCGQAPKNVDGKKMYGLLYAH